MIFKIHNFKKTVCCTTIVKLSSHTVHGTVSVLLSYTPCKYQLAMSDLQRYPISLNLIKNMEDPSILTEQVSNSGNFSIGSYKQEMRKSLSKRTRKKIKKLKLEYLIHT